MKKRMYVFIPCIAILVISIFISTCLPPIHGTDREDPDLENPMDSVVRNRLVQKVKDNGGEEILLDLSDEDEYKFVEARLSLSSKNKKNSPQLFRSLERARNIPVKMFRDGEDDDENQGNKHIIVKLELNEQNRLVVSASGSVKEGATYVYLDVVAADKNWNHLTSYQFTETFDTEQLDVSSDGNVSHRGNRTPEENGFYCADTLLVYEDSDGLHVSYYSFEHEASTVYPIGMVIDDPREKAVIHDDDNIVKVCLYRSHGDCDYELTGSPGRHILLPFKGYIDFGFPIKTDPENPTRVSPTVVAEEGSTEPIRNLDLGLCLPYGTFTKRQPGNSQVQKFWNNAWVTTGKDWDGNDKEYSRLEWDLTGNPFDFGYEAFRHCEVVNFYVTISVPLADEEHIGDEVGNPGTAFIIPEDHYEGSPYIYKPIISDMDVGTGTHTLQVVGKENPTDEFQMNEFTQYEWTVDVVPPGKATLYNTPLAKTNTKKFSINVDGPDIERYRYQLTSVINDGSPDSTSKSNPKDKGVPIFQDFTSSPYTKIAYTLSVWGMDKAGNEQTEPTLYEWTYISPIHPEEGETIIEAQLADDDLPSFYTNDDDISITVEGNDIGCYKYVLDGDESEIEEINDKITAENLPEGPHKLEVYGSVYDAENDDWIWQDSGTPTIYEWYVDTTPPIASFNLARSIDENGIFLDKTTATDIVIEVTGDDIVWYNYSLDEESYVKDQDIQTLITESNLVAGQSHSIYIRGKDRAGNLQPESQRTEYIWWIGPDPANPEVFYNYIILRNLPRSVTNNTKINIQLKNTGLASFKYRFNPALWGDELPLKDFMKMPKMQFAYSCVSKDTVITMADGSRKEIPLIKKGEKVIAYSGSDGQRSRVALPVFDLVTGHEEIPMYRIIDDKGNSLLLTQGHPVVMNDGSLKLARDLQVGDKVQTESGISTLVIVATETYDGIIYNLVLGNADNRSNWLGNGFVMVGNGFLIGDNTMQEIQQNLATRPKEDLLSRLPEEWRIDYLNSLKRK
jgi:hypothetical protein